MPSSFHSPFPYLSPSPAQHRRVNSPRKLAAMVISGLTVGLACIFFLWGLSNKIRQFQSGANSDEHKSTKDSFCCLAFLEGLRVDREKDPCEDFQQYVCTRKGTASQETSSFRWNSWNAREALAYSRDYPEALSGQLLDVLRSRCEASLRRGPLEFAKEMTLAIFHAAQLQRTMNADQLLLFIAFLSLRLRIKTPVDFTVIDSPHPTFRVDAPMRTLAASLASFNRTCPQCIDGVLNSVEDHTQKPIRLSEYWTFEATFNDRLNSIVSSCSPNMFRASNATTAWDTLSRRVFQTSAPLHVRMVCVSLPGRIFAVFKELATRVFTPLPLASVLTRAVACLYQDLTATNSSASTTPDSKHQCLFEKSLPHIWVNYYAEVIVNAPKNQLARDIFFKVTNTVGNGVITLLAPGQGKASLSYLQGLSPFLPYNALPRNLTPPAPVSNFSALLLSIKDYEFRQASTRRQLHFPRWLFTGDAVYVSEPWVVFTPWSYALLDVLNSRKHLMNAPVLGVPAAKAIWHFLLDKKGELTAAFLKKESGLLSCLVGKTATLMQRRDILEVVLALRTVVSATKTDRWDKSWNVSTNWPSVSESQLFFLRLGDSLCDSGDSNLVKLLNVVLRHDEAFAAAFKCPDRGANSKRPHCFDSAMTGI